MKINLQLFAEDKEGKTEKATPKKDKMPEKKGQVFQSRELSSAFLLVMVFLYLKIFGKQIYIELAEFTNKMFEEYAKTGDFYTINGFSVLFIDTMTVLLKTVGPVFAVAVVAGLGGAYSQVGFIFTLDPIAIKLNRLNPIQGFKRIFSLRGFTELLKALIKILIVGSVVYFFLKDEVYNILSLMYLGLTVGNIYSKYIY